MMQPEQRDVNAEILERLERIEAGVQATNGRVLALEAWKAEHQPWSEAGRALIEQQSAKIEEVGERMTEVLLACQMTPSNFERSVAKVLDQRQTAENAARYTALVRRFGSDPEDSLNRWAGVKTGAKAVGWKVALTAVTFLVTGMLMWIAALWAVSLGGTTP